MSDEPDPQVAARAATLGIADVRAAAQVIAGRVFVTPLLSVPALDAAVGHSLWLKCENLQRIGAFKARGAMTALARMDPARRSRGVLTYSSGNHAQAVALAAREFSVAATIVMPEDAPAIKVAGVRSLGATIVVAGTTSDHRKRVALEIAAQQGLAIVPPFDDVDIICGQGTATLEGVEEMVARTGGLPDAIVVPVGGGGVIAGACLVARRWSIPVISVEPVGCDAMAQSLAAGERVEVPPGPTLADGLKPVQVGALNFAIARADVALSATVDDALLGRALAGLALKAKLVVEPSGAAAVAAALDGAIARLPQPAPEARPRRVLAILTGGNVDAEVFARVLLEHAGAWS